MRKKVDKDGYALLHAPDHPFAHRDGYVLRSHLAFEDYHRCVILPGSVVHHINGDRTDDRPENLEVTQRGKHASRHHKGKATPEDTRKKMSEARKRRWGEDPEYRRRISESNTGKKHSAEARRKMSETARKRKRIH